MNADDTEAADRCFKFGGQDGKAGCASRISAGRVYRKAAEQGHAIGAGTVDDALIGENVQQLVKNRLPSAVGLNQHRNIGFDLVQPCDEILQCRVADIHIIADNREFAGGIGFS